MTNTHEGITTALNSQSPQVGAGRSRIYFGVKKQPHKGYSGEPYIETSQNRIKNVRESGRLLTTDEMDAKLMKGFYLIGLYDTLYRSGRKVFHDCNAWKIDGVGHPPGDLYGSMCDYDSCNGVWRKCIAQAYGLHIKEAMEENV